MGYDEFIAWKIYYRYDPFGREREDMQAGIVSATVANSAPREKGSRAFNATDFMPDFDKAPKRQQTIEEQIQQAEVFTIALGGRDLRKKKK